jgi:MFS transporter, ACS family, allantoate permease
MCIVNGLNYCDKVAMGWAVLFTFKTDLHLVGDDYSWASSIFYFGLLASQYPSNYLLQRFSTVKVLSGAILLWGSMMLAILGCNSYAAILVVRFILGCAEAGVSPALIMYTSVWYTRDEQVPRTLIWSMMQGCFAIIGALLSYGRESCEITALPSKKLIVFNQLATSLGQLSLLGDTSSLC